MIYLLTLFILSMQGSGRCEWYSDDPNDSNNLDDVAEQNVQKLDGNILYACKS